MDIYEPVFGFIDGQSLPVTDLADGDYVLENEANARHFFTETDYQQLGRGRLPIPPRPHRQAHLVVPKNAVSEGSYGRSSSGAEIPQGTSACLTQQVAVTCP